MVSAIGGITSAPPGTAQVSLPTRFPASEVAAYILRPDVVKFWLGSESELTARVGSSARIQRLTLADHGLVWDAEPTGGVVKSCGWRGGFFELVVDWDRGDALDAGVRFRVVHGVGDVVRDVTEVVRRLARCASLAGLLLRTWRAQLTAGRRLVDRDGRLGRGLRAGSRDVIGSR